ncbi:MAG: 50S ribosomal protein L6 [Clostridia bacterium]|nr:50S ribosomal protein L6 [Clostridia bacterium]
MSRIGKLPIVLPAGVSVAIDGHSVQVTGPKGVLKREFSPLVDIALEDNALKVSRRSDQPAERALHGLTRSLLNNMVVGVSAGFQKKLNLVGVGYRAALNGNKLALSIGKSHPVEMDPGPDLKVEVPQPAVILISGIDKEKVGAFAAQVREQRPPEPYKGKGIKYADEVIRRKAGKSGAKK